LTFSFASKRKNVQTLAIIQLSSKAKGKLPFFGLEIDDAWLWCFDGQAGREVTDDGTNIFSSSWGFVFGVLSSAVGPFRARLTS
jgi:hypothetical protein